MKKKIFLISAISTIALSAIFCIFLIIFRTSYNKYDKIVKLEGDDGQEVYVLGTFHGKHFDKNINYSIKDIENVIKNVNPDLVLIEARKETLEKYDAIDGPIDMIFVYSYCKENDIDVELIDWWEINNDVRPNSTNEERDDKIYENIRTELTKVENAGKKVLVVCGSAHLPEQTKRLEKDMYREIKIQNKEELFKDDGSDFEYPIMMLDVIKRKIEYQENEQITEFNEKVTDVNKKEELLKNNKELIESLNKQLKLVEDNKLYSE